MLHNNGLKSMCHAKVTPRHFYEHFKDREAILIAVFNDIFATKQHAG